MGTPREKPEEPDSPLTLLTKRLLNKFLEFEAPTFRVPIGSTIVWYSLKCFSVVVLKPQVCSRAGISRKKFYWHIRENELNFKKKFFKRLPRSTVGCRGLHQHSEPVGETFGTKKGHIHSSLIIDPEVVSMTILLLFWETLPTNFLQK